MCSNVLYFKAPWSFKCDNRCLQPVVIFKGPAVTFKGPAITFKKPALTFKGLAVIFKGHLSSLLKDQGGLKNTVHYCTLQGNGTLLEKIIYISGISAKNAIK